MTSIMCSRIWKHLAQTSTAGAKQQCVDAISERASFNWSDCRMKRIKFDLETENHS